MKKTQVTTNLNPETLNDVLELAKKTEHTQSSQINILVKMALEQLKKNEVKP